MAQIPDFAPSINRAKELGNTMRVNQTIQVTSPDGLRTYTKVASVPNGTPIDEANVLSLTGGGFLRQIDTGISRDSLQSAPAGRMVLSAPGSSGWEIGRAHV